MPSCSSRVRDALNRPDRRSKTPTLAAFVSISSGPRIQDGLTKTKAPKMTAFVEEEATLVSAVGERKIVSSVVHLLSKSATRLHTRTMKTTLRLLYQSHQETLSTCVLNQTHQKTAWKARRRIDDRTLGQACDRKRGASSSSNGVRSG